MFKVKSLGCVVSLACFASLAHATVKVGVIDIQRAIQESKKASEAKSTLEKEALAKDRGLEPQRVVLQKLQETLQKSAAGLSPKAREEKLAEFNKKAAAFEQSKAKNTEELRMREMELLKPIVEGLRSTAGELSKKRDLDMVLDSNVVIWAAERSDITADVIQTYNAK